MLLPAQTATPDLTQASLEDLMNIQVTSVSKKEQKLSDAGAAVFVITQEDIRRSGATNIPDVLRLAPGVDVAQINSSRWAIGIRGFNDAYSNKVLVLVDGRSVYNSTFNGVFWDGQNVPLEDIDRIEVIRGPGGTMWGANAVNGVINIITKSAWDTEGGLMRAGAGSHDRGDGLLQYGGPAGRNGAYRVFGSSFDIGNSASADGLPVADAWYSARGGFRTDWNVSRRDSLTVEGDAERTSGLQPLSTMFSNTAALPVRMDDAVSNSLGNVLGRWDHRLEGGSQTSLQFYNDYVHRSEQGFQETIHTSDLDFEHHLSLNARNDMVWGLDARLIESHFDAGYTFGIEPRNSTNNLLSGFVQDEVRISDTVRLTLGSKLEHTDTTGFEFEPSGQLAWTPSSRQTIWVSAARAVRQPGSMDLGMHVEATAFPAGDTIGVVELYGNPQLGAEHLYDFEAGYRAQVSRAVSLDVAAFSSFYRNLEAAVPQGTYFSMDPGPPHLVLDNTFENTGRAHTYGLEFFANWRVTTGWRISPGYSMLRGEILGAGLVDTQVGLSPGSAPANQFQLRSLLNLRRNLEWDSDLAYVGRLQFGSIPGYTRLDSRLGWRLAEFAELSVVGQNLLTPRHPEFADEYGLVHTEVARSVFTKITWRF